MQKTVYACDECNMETSDPKDWMRVIEIHGGVSVTKWTSELMPAKNRKVNHACGRACVIQAVQKWMNPKLVLDLESGIVSPLNPKGDIRRVINPGHQDVCEIHYGKSCNCETGEQFGRPGGTDY